MSHHGREELRGKAREYSRYNAEKLKVNMGIWRRDPLVYIV
jgi:hypothetical protein